MKLLRNFYPNPDTGLLLMRVGLGIMYMCHGWPKISGGSELWMKLGGAMQNLGIGFAPAFWGFMDAFAEFFGGLLLAMGLFTRPALVFLIIAMCVATTMHLSNGDNFGIYSHPVENAITFLGLLFIGPGKYSLDEKFFPGNLPKV